jgi:L-ascorbate metabolism protein UlaG (beta-lactamase superfamily)
MMLVTHEHKEHFQPDLTCQIMAACPESTLIAPREVINQLRQSRYFKKRFITQIISVDLDLNKSIEFTLKGITVRAAHIMHDEPEKHSDIQNVAFLLNMGEHKILHVGDALPDFAHFQESGLADAGVNCAIVPYKYLINRKRNRHAGKSVSAVYGGYAFSDKGIRQSENIR